MADVSNKSSLKDDPLHAYSGLTLFPRTLKSLSKPFPPPLYQSEDLQQTHTLLESMPFEIQKEHLEQAKAILEDMSEDIKLKPFPNKRERRPGLDRKRKAFSLNLTTSQPPPVPPSFDGSKYPRPEDFFAEYDKFELANREWQKQTGCSEIDTQQNPPSRRPRRPEIPGRKRRPYKHTYTDSHFTDSINLEASEKKSPIPSEQSLDRTTAAHVMTADKEVDDSTIDTDKDLTNILTELLACSRDELEGDGAVKLLEDRLQIKSFNVEKFSIPEFQDVRKMDLKASGRKPSNRKSVLSDIQNMLKETHRDAKKHSSSPIPPQDQFSFPDIHNLPGDLQSSEVDLQPLEKDIANTSSSNVGAVDAASPFNNSVEKSSGENDSDTHSGRFNSSTDGNADNCVDESISNQNTAMLEVNVDMQSTGKEVDVPMSESIATRKIGERENDADINEETDHLERLVQYASREVTRPFTVEEDSIPYQQESVVKKPKKTVTREGEIFSRRKSLAAAGTKMEGGVRRSTRIKSRPLEYWKGERFLYGRIHESLTTVIGIKYGSPGEGKGDWRASKVKSFVSDEYKELVDFAALH